MDMVDERNENRLTMTVHRCYPVLLAALAFAISGCATTVGLGQAALREGRYSEAASKFETALTEHPERTDALVGLGIARYARWAYAPWPYYGHYGYYDPFFWGWRSW